MKEMKLSSLLFLYLLLALLLFETAESSSNQPHHRFQPRDVETSGTGTSEHEGTGSIPTTSAGHNQGANTGQENAENLSQFGQLFGGHPFLLNFAQQQNQGFVSSQTELTDNNGKKY